MHEKSLLRGLLGQIDSIARAQGSGRVTAVRIRLGALAHIEAEHLREHYADAIRGSALESARLEIETTDALEEITLLSIDLES